MKLTTDRIPILFASLLLLYPATSQSAVALSLVKAGTTTVSTDSIPFGTSTFSLDLRLDTDGNPAGGLQFNIATTPAETVSFAAPSVTPLNSPFTAADVEKAPLQGAICGRVEATTIFFAQAGDYAPFVDRSISTLKFNTSSLPAGSYTFFPRGEEFIFGNTTITTFGSPGAFVLTVVPEPAGVMLLLVGAILLAFGRGRN